MTMSAVEQVELAAGNGANLFTVADMSATTLTGLITYTGGSSSDTIGAAAAVNPFDVSAGGGNDQIATGSAADRVCGEAGDDFLNGGLGNDTAVYAGNVGEYRIDFASGGDIRITDLRAGAPEGVDTLRGIENAEFANATLSFLFGTPGDDNFVALRQPGDRCAGLGNDTITFDFRLVDATVTYAGNSVHHRSAASHTVLSGFETYVFTDGTVNNKDADVLVDDLFYYAQNHDVWNAQRMPTSTTISSAGTRGATRTRSSRPRSISAANPDVKAAGVDPLIHFDQVGWKEGRVPVARLRSAPVSRGQSGRRGGACRSARALPAFGAQEGRVSRSRRPSWSPPNGFDYVYYLQHNPDVAAAHVDPFAHFQTIGWNEGRNPNALFDIGGYLAAYADVAAAHINPLDHYQPVRLARGPRSVGRLRHDRLSRGQSRRRGGRTSIRWCTSCSSASTRAARPSRTGFSARQRRNAASANGPPA